MQNLTILNVEINFSKIALNVVEFEKIRLQIEAFFQFFVDVEIQANFIVEMQKIFKNLWHIGAWDVAKMRKTARTVPGCKHSDTIIFSVQVLCAQLCHNHIREYDS